MSNKHIKTSYLIIGAGIAGLSLGIGLAQRKKNFLIIDKVPKISGIGAGIGLTSNAIAALKTIGMDTKVQQVSNPLIGLSLANSKGKIIAEGNPQKLPGYNLTNYAIHRGHLHTCLLDELPHEYLMEHLECQTIRYHEKVYEVQCKNGTIIHCDYLIGADGINSVVRQFLFPESKLRYAGYTCWRAVINWPEQLPSSSIETWGAQGRFGITPLQNGQVYWYACINAPQVKDKQFTQFQIKDLQQRFSSYHHLVTLALQHTHDEHLIQNDIFDLQPLKQYHKAHAVLIGDAAHATTPNLGQGACMGFEDVTVLLQEIDKATSTKIDDAFAKFTQRRQQRCNQLVNTARLLGSIAQIDQPWLIAIRNNAMGLIPQAIQNQQLKKVLDTRSLNLTD